MRRPSRNGSPLLLSFLAVAMPVVCVMDSRKRMSSRVYAGGRGRGNSRWCAEDEDGGGADSGRSPRPSSRSACKCTTCSGQGWELTELPHLQGCNLCGSLR